MDKVKKEINLPFKPIRITCKTCRGKKIKQIPDEETMNHPTFLKEIPCDDCKEKGYYKVNNL